MRVLFQEKFSSSTNVEDEREKLLLKIKSIFNENRNSLKMCLDKCNTCYLCCVKQKNHSIEDSQFVDSIKDKIQFLNKELSKECFKNIEFQSCGIYIENYKKELDETNKNINAIAAEIMNAIKAKETQKAIETIETNLTVVISDNLKLKKNFQDSTKKLLDTNDDNLENWSDVFKINVVNNFDKFRNEIRTILNNNDCSNILKRYDEQSFGFNQAIASQLKSILNFQMDSKTDLKELEEIATNFKRAFAEYIENFRAFDRNFHANQQQMIEKENKMKIKLQVLEDEHKNIDFEIKKIKQDKEVLDKNIEMTKLSIVMPISIDFDIENVETMNKFISLNEEIRERNTNEISMLTDQILKVQINLCTVNNEISKFNDRKVEFKLTDSMNLQNVCEELNSYFNNNIILKQNETEISKLKENLMVVSKKLSESNHLVIMLKRKEVLDNEIKILKSDINCFCDKQINNEIKLANFEFQLALAQNEDEKTKLRHNIGEFQNFIKKFETNLNDKRENCEKKEREMESILFEREIDKDKIFAENNELNNEVLKINNKILFVENSIKKARNDNNEIVERNKNIFDQRASVDLIGNFYENFKNLKNSIKEKHEKIKEFEDKNLNFLKNINDLELILKEKSKNFDLNNKALMGDFINNQIEELNKSIEQLKLYLLDKNHEKEKIQQILQLTKKNSSIEDMEVDDLEYECQQLNLILIDEDVKKTTEALHSFSNKLNDLRILEDIIKKIDSLINKLEESKQNITDLKLQVQINENEAIEIDTEIEIKIKNLIQGETSNDLLKQNQEKSESLFKELTELNERKGILGNQNESIQKNSKVYDVLLELLKNYENFKTKIGEMIKQQDLKKNNILNYREEIHEIEKSNAEFNKCLSELDEKLMNLESYIDKVENANESLIITIAEFNEILKIRADIKENEIKLEEIMKKKRIIELENPQYFEKLKDETEIKQLEGNKNYLSEIKVSLEEKVLSLENYSKEFNELKQLKTELEIRENKLSQACDCGTDHKCKSKCELCLKKEIFCYKKSAHEGKHICNKPQHNCTESCNVVGCTNKCTHPYGHENPKYHRCEETHQCSSQCIYCSNKCVKTRLEIHEDHLCSETQCSKLCVLCNERCATLNHQHNEFAELVRVRDKKTFKIEKTKKHLCENKHNCPEMCDQPGVCELIYVEKVKNWHTTTANFQFTYIEPRERTANCAKIFEKNKINHENDHDCEKETHTCNVKCPDCGSYCTNIFNHDGEHSTISHRNKESCYFVNTAHKKIEVISKDKSVRVYMPGEQSTPEICSESCARRGRAHYHLKKCNGESDCVRINKELESYGLHSNEKYIGFEESNFDKYLCYQYWESFNWKPPLNDEFLIQQNKLCNCSCPHYSHKSDEVPSFCTKDAWHTKSLSIHDHVFECEHDDIYCGVDVCFVLDTTGSMSPYIEKSKKSIESIIQSCTVCFGMNTRQIQFAVVAYRDHPPQDESYVTKVHDFGHQYEAIDFLNTLDANGGGDAPEAVLDALDEATKLNWNKKSIKFLFHILDSPGHGRVYGSSSDYWPDGCPCMKQDSKILNELNNLKIIYYVASLTSSLNLMLKEFEKYIKVLRIELSDRIPFEQAISDCICEVLQDSELTIIQESE